MPLRRVFSALMLCALVTACASVATDKSDGAIAVASNATLKLLPAKSMLHNVSLTQRIDATHAKADKPAQTRSFVVQIEAGTDDVRMVGLTPMGVQVFAMTLQGSELDVDVPPYLSLPFDPRFMLADMQLALADAVLLNSHLAGAQIRTSTDNQRRELVIGDAVRMRIDYQGRHCTEGAETRIEHFERHYQIRITTLSCDAL